MGGGLTLPDSLTAGRGEAMPWEKVEAAEKGSGAFSLSPIGSGRNRAEGSSQSVMNSLFSGEQLLIHLKNSWMGVNKPAAMFWSYGLFVLSDLKPHQAVVTRECTTDFCALFR